MPVYNPDAIKKHGSDGAAPLSILLVAVARQDDPAIDQAKETLLPVLGNIAMKKAILAHLDGTEVQFDQIDPQRITIKAVPKTDMVTLRVHIALDYIERQHRDCVLKQPAFALSLVGIEEHIKEAKTYQWSSAYRMISGYMQIPREKLGPTLLPSGHGGVFFQRLARDGVQPNADVEWHSWVEGQSYEEYHQSAMNRAFELKSYLTVRKGDGSNLGAITDKLLHRDRHWANFGIPQHAGPNTVTGILQELGWEVVHRPSEPGSKNRPWTFFGKPKNDEMKDNYTYVHPDENNSEQYLRICIHNRHRKLQEDEVEHFDNKLKWWDATVSPTLRYEPEIAPTLPDSPEED